MPAVHVGKATHSEVATESSRRPRAHWAASTCIPREWADAYNDVHRSDGPANGRQDTRWGLQQAFLTSVANG
jgi:hypothetical protein